MTGLPNYFQGDNFAERRNATESAGVAYDPESLLTGAEEAAGLTYHDHRVWPSREAYDKAVGGGFTPEQIAAIAPRVKVANAVGAALTRPSEDEEPDIAELFPGCMIVSLDALASGRVTLE